MATTDEDDVFADGPSGSLEHDTRNDRNPDDSSFQAQMAENPDAMTAAAQGRLRSIIERIENLEEDKAAVMEDLKGVYAEAKGEGFDTKILRKVVRMRKQDKVKRDEEEALIDLYFSAIGGL